LLIECRNGGTLEHISIKIYNSFIFLVCKAGAHLTVIIDYKIVFEKSADYVVNQLLVNLIIFYLPYFFRMTFVFNLSKPSMSFSIESKPFKVSSSKLILMAMKELFMADWILFIFLRVAP